LIRRRMHIAGREIEFSSTGPGKPLAAWCPLHQADSPTLTLDPATGFFRCRSCRARGKRHLLLIVSNNPGGTTKSKAR